jgi:hypothetical protein
MSAMGLGGGGGGGGSGNKALEGITEPPKGRPGGQVTPDVAKQLNDKKQLIAAAGGGAGGGAPAAASGGSTAPGSGGAAKTAAAPAAGGGAPAGGTSAPGGGGHAAKSPHAPTAPTGPQAPAGGAPGANHGVGGAAHGDGAGSVEAMIEELEHGHDSGARVRAAEALGKLKTPKAKPALEKATRDRDPAVAAAAVKALKQVG